jgi:G3E family GTPase
LGLPLNPHQVDAKHIMRHLRPASSALALVRRRPEAQKQLAMADRVVLNKVDLATPAELDEARAL